MSVKFGDCLILSIEDAMELVPGLSDNEIKVVFILSLQSTHMDEIHKKGQFVTSNDIKGINLYLKKNIFRYPAMLKNFTIAEL